MGPLLHSHVEPEEALNGVRFFLGHSVPKDGGVVACQKKQIVLMLPSLEVIWYLFKYDERKEELIHHDEDREWFF